MLPKQGVERNVRLYRTALDACSSELWAGFPSRQYLQRLHSRKPKAVAVSLLVDMEAQVSACQCLSYSSVIGRRLQPKIWRPGRRNSGHRKSDLAKSEASVFIRTWLGGLAGPCWCSGRGHATQPSLVCERSEAVVESALRRIRAERSKRSERCPSGEPASHFGLWLSVVASCFLARCRGPELPNPHRSLALRSYDLRTSSRSTAPGIHSVEKDLKRLDFSPVVAWCSDDLGPHALACYGSPWPWPWPPISKVESMPATPKRTLSLRERLQTEIELEDVRGPAGSFSGPEASGTPRSVIYSGIRRRTCPKQLTLEWRRPLEPCTQPSACHRIPAPSCIVGIHLQESGRWLAPQTALHCSDTFKSVVILVLALAAMSTSATCSPGRQPSGEDPDFEFQLSAKLLLLLTRQLPAQKCGLADCRARDCPFECSHNGLCSGARAGEGHNASRGN